MKLGIQSTVFPSLVEEIRNFTFWEAHAGHGVTQKLRISKEFQAVARGL